MGTKRIILFICLVLSISFIAGCASTSKTSSSNKIFELQYKPVSGHVYTYQGLRFEVSCPLRTRGKDNYFYALKKRPSPLESPKKYVLFDLSVQNPSQLNFRIPDDSIVLAGSSGKEYKPLSSIVPDTNRTRFLLRNVTSFKTIPFIYAIFVFDNIPENETELQLRFQIEVEDLLDHHYVLFEKQRTDPELMSEWDDNAQRIKDRDRLIKEYTDEEGYVNPGDLKKIQK